MQEKIELEVLPGDSIYRAARRAAEKAQKTQRTVWFDFNGEQIHVAPDETVQDVIDAWEDRQDLARREARASPAYVREQTRRAKEAQQNQCRVNQLLIELDLVLKGKLPALLRWLAEFTDAADRVDVLIPHKRLAKKLGHIAPANMNVGRDDLQEPSKERDAALWVIGQAVASFEKERPPHPILAGFAKGIADRFPCQS